MAGIPDRQFPTASPQDDYTFRRLFDIDLPERVSRLAQAWAAVDRSQLHRLVSQIDEGCASGKLTDLGQCATRVEYAVLAAESEISQLAEQVEALIEQCRKAAEQSTSGTEGCVDEPNNPS